MPDEAMTWSLLRSITPQPDGLPPTHPTSEPVDWNILGPGIRAVRAVLEQPQAPRPPLRPTDGEPIARPAPRSLVRDAVHGLPPDRVLHARDAMRVLLMHGDEAPVLLHELGRLREEAFRALGEGTGQALDLDLQDTRYDHLVLWDDAAAEVLGAYRVGRVDALLAPDEGMYLASLFQFAPELWDALGPALELGRAFITPGRQRSPLALSDLWQGIGRYLCDRPRYRKLLGAVSIDRQYSDLSLHLMVGHLRARHSASRLVPMVTPRTPLPASSDLERSLRSCGAAIPDLGTLDEVVARLEPGERGIPVLFRSYMGLGARVLGVNVDPDFQDSVDALVVVDLDQADPRRLRRFMGRARHQEWSRG